MIGRETHDPWRARRTSSRTGSICCKVVVQLGMLAFANFMEGDLGKTGPP